MNYCLTGGLGQLGTGLAKILRQQYGRDNIILSDIIRPSKVILDDGKFLFFTGYFFHTLFFSNFRAFIVVLVSHNMSSRHTFVVA